MKRIFLPALLIVLLAGNVFAQVSGGVRLGGNLSNLKWSAGDLSMTDDSKFGLLAGVYLTAMLSDRVGIQPELAYSSMGSKQDEDGTVKLNYIALPVLLRYQIVDQIHLLVGPQASFLMSAKYEEDGDEEDIKDSVKGLDFGAVFGVGADISRFNVGLRYGLGLANIFDEDGGEGVEVKSRAFQIVLGYKLFGD
ncbi:MAG: porin family protein [Bacteroidota bacterium]